MKIEQILLVSQPVNVLFFIISHIYRSVYLNKITEKYINKVEDNKPATILLAALKIVMVSTLVFMYITSQIIRLITFNKLKVYHHNNLTTVLVVYFYGTISLFAFFPIVLMMSILGLFVNYTVKYLNFGSK